MIDTHETVLLKEAVDLLITSKNGVYVDGTFGCGGHSLEILSRLNLCGRLIAFDKDRQAIMRAQNITDKRLTSIHSSFSELKPQLLQANITQVSGVLLDLGVSSAQLNNPDRGFSFLHDGPLDMRMNISNNSLTIREWLASSSCDDISEVISKYGEERFAKSIAKAIVLRREQNPKLGILNSSLELAKLIATAVKTREAGFNPATRTFQALRIFINNELQDLKDGLSGILAMMAPGARLVVLSFHSLEDRIVKHFMRDHSGKNNAINLTNHPRYRHLPLRPNDFQSQSITSPQLKLLGRFRASSSEIKRNRRARSVVMRAAEKLV